MYFLILDGTIKESGARLARVKHVFRIKQGKKCGLHPQEMS